MNEHWIWLCSRRGLGPVRQRKLLEQFGAAEAVYAAAPDELRREGLNSALVEALRDHNLGPAREILRVCAEKGIRVLTRADPDYPASLAAVPDAPLVLYLRGKLPDLEQHACIALVGSRSADKRGLHIAYRLGWQIAGCGGVTVTGLARGIDTAAAWGALNQGGPVIGVLGCGADVVYPRENRDLYARVAEQGCLLTEYPPGTAPNGNNFPVRNRIISALSDGVTVVQAAEQSGALITARWAADQGRDVFAVPGPPESDLSQGCNQLLREGAILVQCGWDILCEYEYRYPGTVWEYHGRPPALSKPRPGPEAAAEAAPLKEAGPEAAAPPGRRRRSAGPPPWTPCPALTRSSKPLWRLCRRAPCSWTP